MFKFLQSIFGKHPSKGNYPESLINNAIERAVEGTDPWIRAVSGYKKKLRPAVLRAIDHVVALVDGMPPPIAITPDSYENNELLRTFFISTADMLKTISNDRNLADFRKNQERAMSGVHALLVMDKDEKGVFGVGLSGDIILHDVPQITVSFDEHRLVGISESENETRRLLKHRAYDYLLGLALSRITVVKTERDHLDKYRALLRSKLALLKREGFAFDKSTTDGPQNVAQVEQELARIEYQLLDLGGDDQMLNVYLDILLDVLGKPEVQLWTEHEALIRDRMGIKQAVATDDIPELLLDMLYDVNGRNMVVSLVSISEDAIFNRELNW